MNRMYRAHCCLFDCILSFQSDDLLARYGDEIRAVFQEKLSDAWQEGSAAILRVWSGVLAETVALTAPRYVAGCALCWLLVCWRAGSPSALLWASARLGLRRLFMRALRKILVLKALLRTQHGVASFRFLTDIGCFWSVPGMRVRDLR